MPGRPPIAHCPRSIPIKQAGTTALHDLPVTLPTQPAASRGGSGTADGHDGEGGEEPEAAAAFGSEVDS